MHSRYKTFGAIFLVTGTCIGGGMLALPLVTAKCGLMWSMLIFLGCWATMLSSSLLVLEVNSALPPNSSFSSMAEATIGPWGKILTWAMFLLLLYALLTAYDTAGASLMSAFLTQLGWALQLKWCAVLFTLIFGSLIYVGIRLTDYANRILLSIKLLLFFLATIWIAPHLNTLHWSLQAVPAMAVLAPIPVVLTAFGSHFVIPSIRSYIGPEPRRLRFIIWVGMLIPLLVYMIWQLLILGTLPLKGPHSVISLTSQKNALELLLLNLVHFIHNAWVRTALNGFMGIAVTTSFLGIALSLLDFFIDGFKLQAKRYTHRLIAAILTFVIPLLFAIFFPNGFVLALRYAAVFAAVLVLILPAIMSLRLRAKGLQPFYVPSGGVPLRIAILVLGLFIIVLSIVLSLK